MQLLICSWKVRVVVRLKKDSEQRWAQRRKIYSSHAKINLIHWLFSIIYQQVSEWQNATQMKQSNCMNSDLFQQKQNQFCCFSTFCLRGNYYVSFHKKYYFTENNFYVSLTYLSCNFDKLLLKGCDWILNEIPKELNLGMQLCKFYSLKLFKPILTACSLIWSGRLSA